MPEVEVIAGVGGPSEMYLTWDKLTDVKVGVVIQDNVAHVRVCSRERDFSFKCQPFEARYDIALDALKAVNAPDSVRQVAYNTYLNLLKQEK